jgi:tetratricopeptide (TPR) repeat protein
MLGSIGSMKIKFLSSFNMKVTCVLLALFFASISTKAQALRGRVSYENDTVHLELNGAKDWTYDLKRKTENGKTYAELLIDGLDEKTENDIRNFKSPLISKIDVQRGVIDGKVKVIFQLTGSEIETFDYLTDQPSRLIVDFYPSDESKAKTAGSKSPKASKIPPETSQSETVQVKTLGTRQPASSDLLKIDSTGSLQLGSQARIQKAGVYDGADPFFERFNIKDFQIKEESIIKSKDQYRIEFPNIETVPTDFVQVLNAPNLYQIIPNPDDENKQARLLLTLFEKGRLNVYQKTLKWFKEKYPESKYNEVIDFVTAEVYVKLWRQDPAKTQYFSLALQQYQSASQKYPNSTLAEKSSFLQGALSFDKKEYFNSLRHFLSHKQNVKMSTKNNYSKDLALLGVALSYEKIKKFADSISAYEQLEKNTPYATLREEAVYRIGDVHLNSGQFEKAVESYQRALKKEPAAAGKYPSALYNQAQALFAMKDFKKSIQVYLDFIKSFPQNENVPYALTRVGELLEILGASEDKVIGAYMETAFRFGNDSKAAVAQIRLLSARMSQMKPKEVEQATKEIMSLSKKADFPKIEEFSTVMIAEGYQKRKEYEKSIALLEGYYQQNPSSVDTKLFKKRIVANISDKIKLDVQSGANLRALEFFKKYADGWLKQSERLDTGFYLGKAYEKLGAHQEALKYYNLLASSLKKIEGTNELKEKNIQESLPSAETLSLRMAASHFHLNQFKESTDSLKKIKNPELLSDEDQIDRVILISKNEEKRGDDFTAKRFLRELIQAWTGKPELLSEPLYRIGVIDQKFQRPSDAIDSFKKIQKLDLETQKVPAEIQFQTLSRLIEIYTTQNDKENLIKTYSEILEKFEESRPLGSLRYKLGQIYFEKGDVQKASDVWSEFKGQKIEFWKNLAQDQMKNAEWKDGYKKYIQRIPAMSQKE